MILCSPALLLLLLFLFEDFLSQGVKHIIVIIRFIERIDCYGWLLALRRSSGLGDDAGNVGHFNVCIQRCIVNDGRDCIIALVEVIEDAGFCLLLLILRFLRFNLLFASCLVEEGASASLSLLTAIATEHQGLVGVQDSIGL